MKIPFTDKDFCLWIVPTNSGKVKKIRFTATRAVVLFCLIGLMLTTLVVVASDYTRVQILRAKSYITLKKLTYERNLLTTQRETLENEIQTTKSVNQKMLSYQQGVSQRLEILREVLDSASALGVIDQEEFAKVSAYRDSDGIGGAEIDCKIGDPRCDTPELNREDLKSLVGEDLSKQDEQDLQLVLDGYLQMIEDIPFGLPANGYVSSGWGRRYSPFSHQLKMHQGIDFSVAAGDFVRATADGVVKSVKRNSTYGLVIDVTHGSGTVVTRYAHLSESLVKEGEKVCRGESIALIGSTGRSTGPHLHFEVRVKNKAHNPMKFFALGKKLASAF